MQGSEITDVLCFLLKKCFLPQGSNSGLDGELAERTVSVEIVFCCSVPETYQVSLWSRLFLFSDHGVVCFEVFILEDTSLLEEGRRRGS